MLSLSTGWDLFSSAGHRDNEEERGRGLWAEAELRVGSEEVLGYSYDWISFSDYRWRRCGQWVTDFIVSIATEDLLSAGISH